MVGEPALKETLSLNVATWGDFEVHLDQILGKGGMGVVYRARQLSLDRPVAVKVLDLSRIDSPERADAFLERFRAEAKAVARVRDPRIISIIQAGQSEGRCWFAMELVDGKTVEERLAEGLFEDREAARIVKEVAHALDAAWRAGVLHRDVKPGNIFLCSDGAGKLGDWGLAKAAESGRTKATTTAAVSCTPAYVSPEAAQGKELDFRADLYSLGCVLYEMTTERPPFSSDSPLELLYRHCHETPPAPRTLNPKIGIDLENVILQCMAKEPDRRYASYAALIADLEEAIPAPAAPPRRSKVAPWIAAAIGATLLAVTTGVVIRVRRDRLVPPHAGRVPDRRVEKPREATVTLAAFKLPAIEPAFRKEAHPLLEADPRSVQEPVATPPTEPEERKDYAKTLARFRETLTQELIGEVELRTCRLAGSVRFERDPERYRLGDGASLCIPLAGARKGYEIRWSGGSLIAVALSWTHWIEITSDGATLFQKDKGVLETAPCASPATVSVVPIEDRTAVFIGDRLLSILEIRHDNEIKIRGTGAVDLLSIRAVARD